MMSEELEDKKPVKKLKERKPKLSDEMGPAALYRNRKEVIVRISGPGSVNNNLRSVIMPHLTHMHCTAEYAFSMGLLVDKDAKDAR